VHLTLKPQPTRSRVNGLYELVLCSVLLAALVIRIIYSISSLVHPICPFGMWSHTLSPLSPQILSFSHLTKTHLSCLFQTEVRPGHLSLISGSNHLTNHQPTLKNTSHLVYQLLAKDESSVSLLSTFLTNKLFSSEGRSLWGPNLTVGGSNKLGKDTGILCISSSICGSCLAW